MKIGLLAPSLFLGIFILISTSDPAAAVSPVCRQLHEAVFMDEPPGVQTLLQNGVDPDCRDEIGQTPLITAVEWGESEFGWLSHSSWG